VQLLGLINAAVLGEKNTAPKELCLEIILRQRQIVSEKLSHEIIVNMAIICDSSHVFFMPACKSLYFLILVLIFPF
jgi:hypothetical protein